MISFASPFPCNYITFASIMLACSYCTTPHSEYRQNLYSENYKTDYSHDNRCPLQLLKVRAVCWSNMLLRRVPNRGIYLFFYSCISFWFSFFCGGIRFVFAFFIKFLNNNYCNRSLITKKQGISNNYILYREKILFIYLSIHFFSRTSCNNSSPTSSNLKPLHKEILATVFGSNLLSIK